MKIKVWRHKKATGAMAAPKEMRPTVANVIQNMADEHASVVENIILVQGIPDQWWMKGACLRIFAYTNALWALSGLWRFERS